VTEGEKGTEQINTRLTYIDGEFADAEVLDTKVTKEPVTEEIIKGCKQGKQESSDEETSGSGDFIWPFPHTHSISSLFEWRWGRMHQGIDIAGGGDYGQPIVAADSGKVTWAGNDGGGYGNYVMIDHGNGYMTVYAHACDVACSTGDYVNQGDTIAYCGSTGNSTGPHVHFEIRVDGTQVDPLGYVS
ncbi:MAG: peptidoglycan DD-metalloendopeptidase family protein, partial [Ruminococcus sp.]|nr:peptidoglycan DD-metalloendopeptidase family protein [Ruminococcus sp.]